MTGERAIKLLVNFSNQDNLSCLKKSCNKIATQDPVLWYFEKYPLEAPDNFSQFKIPILINPEIFQSSLIYTIFFSFQIPDQCIKIIPSCPKAVTKAVKNSARSLEGQGILNMPRLKNISDIHGKTEK